MPRTPPAAQNTGALKVYFADVEGGQATLFVTPAGKSLLVDTGWPGHNNRDADRIVELCKQAGVNKIDNVLITHYHVDHAGGIPQLAAKIPIARFIDHGPNREANAKLHRRQPGRPTRKSSPTATTPTYYAKPGDVLPIKGIRSKSSAPTATSSPNLSPERRAQSACATAQKPPVENTENDRSLGMIITFGKLRIADLGDLTWAKETSPHVPNQQARSR